MSNPYCETLGIEVPSLEDLRDHPAANTYVLLIVALLKQGDAMTLRQVANEFERVRIAPAERALRSLKRCRPARPPVYRDGDEYSLDPFDEELDRWTFRLGLRPPKVPMLQPVPATPEPLPAPEVPLSVAELEEAFRDAYLPNWSAQRVALAVLDSHGGQLASQQVLEVLDRLCTQHCLRQDSANYWRRGAPIRPADDGTWELDTGHPAVRSARKAVRQRLATLRKHPRIDPAVLAVHRRRLEARKAAHAAELAQLSRVLVHAFPPKSPEVIVLVDVATRELTTYAREQLDEVRTRLAEYDLIGAVNVRPLLKAVSFEPSGRLAELGPPQRTLKLNPYGRTLKLTMTLLAEGSCGISRPFGDSATLHEYLRQGQITRLRHRLETDAKSLYALYQYGRLHGAVRVRWGFLEEQIPVPWVYRDEPKLYKLKEQAYRTGQELEAVIGNAPDWADPWARACRCSVVAGDRPYEYLMVDGEGFVVDEWDMQLLRPMLSSNLH